MHPGMMDVVYFIGHDDCELYSECNLTSQDNSFPCPLFTIALYDERSNEFIFKAIRLEGVVQMVY